MSKRTKLSERPRDGIEIPGFHVERGLFMARLNRVVITLSAVNHRHAVFGRDLAAASGRPA